HVLAEAHTHTGSGATFLRDRLQCQPGGHAGETGRRKVGKGKKLSKEGDGGQSGDEASIPEEQSEEPPAERSR
ncbi:unnamed protein product, partial [Ectocarpus fasciculatus]